MANSDKGFASMNPEDVKRIASMGGKAAHAKGKAHRWTSEEAADAGRKGGSRNSPKQRARREALMAAADKRAADLRKANAA